MKGESAAELKLLKDYAMMRGELYRRMPGGVLSRCVGQDEAQKKLKEIHDKTCGSCERSAFAADFKEQVSIGQAWVKTQTRSKPNVGLANLWRTGKKVTLCSSVKTGEAHSYST